MRATVRGREAARFEPLHDGEVPRVELAKLQVRRRGRGTADSRLGVAHVLSNEQEVGRILDERRKSLSLRSQKGARSTGVGSDTPGDVISTHGVHVANAVVSTEVRPVWRRARPGGGWTARPTSAYTDPLTGIAEQNVWIIG
jgi:hypothetical protein